MTNKKTVHDALHRIQKALKAPKEANKNVSYKSRSAEQILEAAKEQLADGEHITCNDEIVLIGDRFYVKATATFTCNEGNISAVGWAREQSESKMMQPPQITGASSSYSRKYALGGLFAIDDSKDDPDKHGVEEKEETILPGEEFSALQKEIQAVKTSEELTEAKNKASAAKPRMSPEQIKVIANEITKASATLVVEKREE